MWITQHGRMTKLDSDIFLNITFLDVDSEESNMIQHWAISITVSSWAQFIRNPGLSLQTGHKYPPGKTQDWYSTCPSGTTSQGGQQTPHTAWAVCQPHRAWGPSDDYPELLLANHWFLSEYIKIKSLNIECCRAIFCVWISKHSQVLLVDKIK